MDPNRRALAPWLASAAAVAIGLVCAWWTLGWGTMSGAGLNLRSAHGDIAAGMAGFRYFVADSWHLPLLHTSQMASPGGTVIAFSDSLPVLALLAKSVRFLGIPAERWWGWWLTGCFVAQGLAGLYAVRAWLRTSWAVAVAAVPLFVMFPPFLLRMLHPGLAFQAPLLLAIGLVGQARSGPSRRLTAAALALPVLALLVHPYHLLVCVVILLAGFLDQVRTGALPGRWLARWAVGGTALLGVVAAVGGYLSQPAVPAYGYGVYSLIPWSPVVPQLSWLWPWPNHVLEAGGSFEGFSFIGLGGLLVVAAGAAVLIRRSRQLIVAHQSLALGLLVLTLYAITPEIHLGSGNPVDSIGYLVRLTGSPHRAFGLAGAVCLLAAGAWVAQHRLRRGSLPPLTSAGTQAAILLAGFGLVAPASPSLVSHFTGTFRVSGRLVWSVGYVALVASVVALARRLSAVPVTLALVSMAGALQAVDQHELRSAGHIIYAPDPVRDARISALAELMRLHQEVALLPSFTCTDGPTGLDEFIDVVQAASLAGVPIDNAYVARQAPAPCPTTPVPPAVTPDRLVVSPVVDTLDTDLGDCRRWATRTTICSDHWQQLSVAAAAAFSPPPLTRSASG